VQDENINIYTRQVRFCAIKSVCGSTQNEINVNGKRRGESSYKSWFLTKKTKSQQTFAREQWFQNGVPGPSTQPAHIYEPYVFEGKLHFYLAKDVKVVAIKEKIN